jgi:hypothetical protein
MSGTTRLAAWLGTWGKPVDRPALWALVLAAVLALLALGPASVHELFGVPYLFPQKPDQRRRIVLILAFIAAFLSLGYVAYYLHAGPRIIDATSYFLEGRVLSHGHLTWTIPSPSASFRGRFLLFHEPNKLAVIFPPGFPLLLAAGFLVGAPLVIGPLLAGALVIATYWLARELANGRDEREREGVALLAAALSIVCVALRYHTADTMAHGASALGITVALAAAFMGTRTTTRGPWLAAGLAVGWVVCTRPVSSFAIFGVVLFLAARRQRWRALLVGMVPGVLFLLLASHAETGSWLVSAQSAYYAVSDGPAGCFRYGFGHGVGCQGEHKDFVLSRLPHGYGAREALLTTLRRLRVHLFDVANLEPLALLVLVPLKRARGRRNHRALTAFAVVVGQIVAYAPFYFDGDYPGGGARFFADVLPVEHALLALGAALLFPRIAFFRRAALLLALAILGFAVHGAFEHEALAERDGGHPMYNPEDARSTTKGLLFFDTDHGFDLAYDPFADPAKAVLAARLRGDDHDRLLVDRLEHPQAHIYRVDPKRESVVGWTAKAGGTKDLWRFEAEADWPPLTQGGGWAEAIWASGSCATEGRALTLHIDPDAAKSTNGRSAFVTIELPVARTGKWTVTPRVFRRGGPGHAKLRLIPRGRAPLPSDEKLIWEWNDNDGGTMAGHDTCIDLPPLATAEGVALDVTGATWELTATGGDVTLDQTTLRAKH